MSLLIIEDGTSVENANSYISAADATAYLQTYEPSSFTDAWPADETEQERALLIGAQALDFNYRDKWVSLRRTPAVNELSWPRYPFWDQDGVLVVDQSIPNSVKFAQATMALYYLQGTDVFPQESKSKHTVEETDRVGELSTTRRYTPNTPYDNFRKVTQMLWRVLANPNTTRMFR